MGARKKKSAAALRTVDMFSGMTPMEEAERVRSEQAPDWGAPAAHASRDHTSCQSQMVETAIEWLRTEENDPGDDVSLAIGPSGNGVLSVLHSSKSGHPSHQAQVRLSSRQICMLRRLLVP
jgi:hypothetical protein